MKQKSRNRFLAALLAVVMMFQMLPMMAFAAEGAGSEGAPSDVTLRSTGKSYSDLQEAVKAAERVDTILLGEGKYSLYGIPSTGMTSGKDLTFVGKGTDKTVWYIGADVPDPNKTGEYNGDYSFDGAGTVTFENMTLRSGPTKDPNTKLGFIRPDNTVVENCEIVGWTAFWGYNSAEFKNTTFKPSLLKDAIWVYSSKEATFEDCTFTAGRGVKVYTEENKSVTVNLITAPWKIRAVTRQYISTNISWKKRAVRKDITSILRAAIKLRRRQTHIPAQSYLVLSQEPICIPVTLRM